LGWAGSLLTGTVLGIAWLWGSYDYFLRYGRDPDLAYAFEAAEVQEAVEINRFLGTGWQGVGASEPGGEPIPGRQVYLGPRMWEDRFSVNLLVGSPERISILGRDRPLDADQVLALAWPYGDMSDVRGVLPRPAQVEVWPGPWERGDLDAEPRLLYAAFRGTRLDATSPAVARFEGGIELLGWDAEPCLEGQTCLRLRWRAAGPLSVDYTVFVHLMGEDRVIAQDDGAPARGYFPTSWWAPGDEIIDERLIAAPYDPRQEQIVVGWYELGSMQHLRVLREEGQLGEDRFELQ
jgi:hypothetical protein